jgi:hypothetical protein
MERINTSNKAIDLFGSGKHGYKSGVPGTADRPTNMAASAMNALQEEAANIVEASGAALIPGNNAQVLAALRSMFSGFDRKVRVTDFPYSAVANGVADDYAAVQAALNSGAKTVVLPPGFYLFSQTPYIKTTGQTIEAHGAYIASASVNASGFVIGWDGAAFIKTDDVTIRGAKFFGADTGAGAVYSYAIAIQPPATNPYVEGGGCSNINIIDVEATGHAMGVVATAADRVKVRGGHFGGMKFHAALVAGGYGCLFQTCFGVSVVGTSFKGQALDRHAVYVSADPARALNNNNVCKRVKLSSLDVNWSGVTGITGFESAIFARSAENLTLQNSTIVGGYGCFDYEAQNGNGKNVTIAGNTLDSPNAGGSERACVTFLRSSGSYVTTGVTISGNTMVANGANLSNVVLQGVDQVTLQGNTMQLSNGVANLNINGAVSNLLAGPNVMSANNCSGVYQFSGAGNADIKINEGLTKYATTVKWRYFSTPANLTCGFVRSATIRANSTAAPVILTDADSIIDSVATDANGIIATFAASVSDLGATAMHFEPNNSTIDSMYYRSRAGQAVTIGVTSSPGVPLPAVSNTYDVTIFLIH